MPASPCSGSIPSFAGSAGRFAQGDSLAYSAGAIFSYPLGNRTGRANVEAARLQAARSLVDLQRLEQQIVVEVDNAAGQVITDRARIHATAEATRLAKESLECRRAAPARGHRHHL